MLRNRMLRSRLLLLPIATLLLLTNCATAERRATAFVGVPLAHWDAAAQKRAYDLIAQRCGKPPLCPPDAVLEQSTLDYVKLRNLVKAAGGKESPKP